MTLLKLNYKWLMVSILTIALTSCSNPWDDRENNGDDNLGVNVYQAIANTAETTEFSKLLTQTGYDKILAASKTYTVFVPTNEAVKAVDPAILNDPASLKKFVENHIALTSFSSVRKNDQEKILMLNDKYLTFKGSTTIDDATIITADRYAANGVFHIINKALTPKLNIWEYINANKGTSAMSAYLVSLKEFSIYKEDADAKEKATAGFLADSLSNSFLRNVYNLNNEKNSYTLFLMEDAGYNAEVDKMKPYLIKKTNNATDSTAIYSRYFTVRDLAFPKAYKKSELPKTLTSRFGVQFDVDQTQIVGEPIQLSNGIIYIMKSVDIKLSNRLVPTIIQGEDNTGYANGVRSKISYRDRKEPNPPFLLYKDIVVPNPGSASFVLYYKAKDLFSTNYKVSWRAINDFQTTAFQQQLRIGGKKDAVTGIVTDVIKFFPLTNVEVNYYQEVELTGDFKLDQAGNIDLISLIANTTTTSPLSLDYLKFVPVVKK